MRKSTAILLNEMEGILSGYVALMNFKFLNLCVKAEPASLLPVTVDYGDTYDLEQVADVTIPQENQLQVYPKDPALLLAIGKAIAFAHPEFKQDIISEKDDAENNNDDAEKTILLTMPAVDKDRRDVLVNGIALLHEETKTKLEGNFTYYTTRAVTQLNGASPAETDEAKKALEGSRQQHLDLAQQYYDAKKEEIEKAYSLYLEKQAAKEQAAKEQQDATDKNAGQSFNLFEAQETATE